MADRRGGTLRAFSVLLYTVVPIVLFFSSYYLIYVQGRISTITERNFRFLATASRQIETRLGGLALALKGAAEECKTVDNWAECSDFPHQKWFVYPELPRQQWPRCDESPSFPHADAPECGESPKERKCCIQHSSLHQVPNLHVLDGCTIMRPGRWLNIGPAQTYWTTDNEPPTVYLKYPAEPYPICAYINLQDLFDPILHLGSDFFDDIVLADESAHTRIMYQQGTDSEGILGIRAVLDDAKVGRTADPAAVKRTAQSSDAKTVGAEPPAAKPATQPDSRTVKGAVEAEDLRLFIQPVRLERVTSEETDYAKPVEWKLCGLVRAGRFSGETMTISPLLLGVLIFFLLIAFVAWPILKLWHLGPRERLRNVDVRVLVIFSVLVVGMVTFALAEPYAHLTRRVTLDQELEGFSKRLRDNFTAELQDAYRQLVSFKSALEFGCQDEDCKPPVTYPYFTQLMRINADGWAKEAWRPVPGEDSKDPQKTGWEAELAATPSISVQDRQYFRNAQASEKAYTDGLWHFPLNGDPAACADAARSENCATFAIEPVLSRASGEMLVVLAAPIHPRSETDPMLAPPRITVSSGDTMPDVAAISTRLVSLTGPVVPVDFRFAVIDNLGKVLLHLDASRNLQENLFQECDQGPRLRAAVLARHGEFLNAQYYGFDERIYVSPLPHTPWSLVVFYDKAPLYALDSAVGIAWSIMFVLYVSAFAVVGIVVQWLRPGYRASWLWPDRRRSYSHPQLLLLVLLVGATAAAMRDDALLSSALLTTVPPLAIALLYLKLNQSHDLSPLKQRSAVAVAIVCVLVVLGISLNAGTPYRYLAIVVLAVLAGAGISRTRDTKLRGSPHQIERKFRTGYVGMLFLLLILFGATPAIVLFRDAYEEGPSLL